MYDFNNYISRKDKGSKKWEQMYKIDSNIPNDILPLSIADMEFKCAPEIIDGLKEELTKLPLLGYTIPTESYFEAIIKWMKKKHHWEIMKEWIIPEIGVIPALFNLIYTYTKPGDGVLIMTPVYYPFYNSILRSGRTLVTSSLRYDGKQYTIDFVDFEKKAQSSDIKLFILCSPHNPVGRVWTNKELTEIVRICIQNDIIIISDEVHFDLVMPGYKHTVLNLICDEEAQNTVICTAPSKTFNLAGLHTCNVIIQNKVLREQYQKFLLSQGHMGLNIMGIKACELAYTNGEKWYDEMLLQINENRKFIEQFMKKNIPKIKVLNLEGTYLQWWDCRELEMNTQELEHFMQKKAMLYLDEGYIFGDEGNGFERINLACPKIVLEHAMRRLKKAYDGL
jgi:Bifunctional PLP-dependent enzyme with beta-cystathionase and maltose regulon repressor activities